ncbi:hypothetical protein SO802_002653 [Lithocarpus litseifolius]|uniref:Uncharacterized protein n=1 Tax=Lithocarpus litseifolius TaxID=425828 RepID=A0AAW2DZR5_9ROSI
MVVVGKLHLMISRVIFSDRRWEVLKLVTVRSKLKSKYKGRVEAAFDYTKTIDDFNELVDTRTLYRHFLGPEPSPYVLRSLLREEEKMATKFSQEMYAKMKAKKKELLSSISQKRPRAVEKEPVKKASSALVIQKPRITSPTVSLEELTPCPKKSRSGDKEIKVDEAAAAIAEGNKLEAEDEAP